MKPKKAWWQIIKKKLTDPYQLKDIGVLGCRFLSISEKWMCQNQNKFNYEWTSCSKAVISVSHYCPEDFGCFGLWNYYYSALTSFKFNQENVRFFSRLNFTYLKNLYHGNLIAVFRNIVLRKSKWLKISKSCQKWQIMT